MAAGNLGGSSAPAALASSAAPAAAGPAGQAAQLNAMLSSAASPDAASAAAAFGAAARPAARAARCRQVAARLWAAGRPHAARAALRACRRIGRIRLVGGMYGQFTFRTKAGVRTIAYERGTVQSASGGSVIVRAADGTTETWSLTSKTVVRQHGSKTTGSALSAGQLVFVAGPVVSGAHDIRLAVIRPGTPGSPSGTSPSGTSGTSASGS